MSKKLPKEEQHYQLSKPYDFRDLEVSLDYKIKECDLLQKQKQRLEEENASLRYDIKRYEKIFEEQFTVGELDDDTIERIKKEAAKPGILERMANPTCPEDYGLSITFDSFEEADEALKSIEEAKKK